MTPPPAGAPKITRSELQCCSYRELQRMALEKGLPANLNKESLIEVLHLGPGKEDELRALLETLKRKATQLPTSNRTLRRHLVKGVLSDGFTASHNQSPIQASNAGSGGDHIVETSTQDVSQDSLASTPRAAEPSTDSLSESQHSNKHANYTEVNPVKGSVESIPSSENCTGSQQQSSYKTKISVPNQARTNGPGCSGVAWTIGPGCSGAAWTNGPGCSGAQKKPFPKPAAPRRPAIGSLTKSTSAKMVPKSIKTSKGISKPKKVSKPNPAPEIPAMKRSETFLKDEATKIPAFARSGTFLIVEATFGDKTPNIDIDH